MKFFVFIVSLLYSISLMADLVYDGYVQFKNGNYEKAKEIFIQACDNKQVDGCYNLAYLYHTIGSFHERKKAVKLYSDVCKNGYVNGCYNLGAIYQKGNIVKQDMKKAIELYSKACDGGHKEACKGYEILYNCPANKTFIY